jgi:hypothetical protein
LFEALRAQGYEGGYDTVRRYARRWQREEVGRTATAFVPLSFEPGEAYQFDWSHEVVVLAGVTATVKVAHIRLPVSAPEPALAEPWPGSSHRRENRRKSAEVKSDRTPIAAAIASLLVLAPVNQKISSLGIPSVIQHQRSLV